MRNKRRAIHRCECKECQRHPYGVIAKEHRAINRVLAGLDEKSRRQCAGLLASQRGRGGIQAVHEISGLSRTTIRHGQHEISALTRTGRIREPGGGRLPVEKKQPGILNALEALLEDETAGDPIRGTKWTRKTLSKLAAGLKRRKFDVGRETVRRLLRRLKYAQHANRKHLSKKQNTDRDRQMRYIACIRHAYEKAGKPVISVDTKKKELIGNFKNAGRTWRTAPFEVMATDFPSDAEGKAIPYGIYDVAHNAGFVVIGTSHETAAFAVNAIRRWWRHEGRHLFPNQTELLILADGGGANGYRSGLWKWELQQLADDIGISIRVMHYPTSASKWNLIEHRLFSYISSNWAGQPLTSYETVLKFIRTTTTQHGLSCKAYLDKTTYVTDRKLSPEQKANINLISHKVLPKWNYTIRPHASTHRK